MSKVQQILSHRTASLELIKAYTKDMKPFFAYVLMRVSEANDMKRKLGNFVKIPENSLVLYSDLGHDVPAGVEDEVLMDFRKLLKHY